MMGKAFMLCAETVHRMGGNADVYIQAYTAWLDNKVAQTDIHVYIHSIHSFALTHKNNPTCARKSILGPNDEAPQETGLMERQERQVRLAVFSGCF